MTPSAPNAPARRFPGLEWLIVILLPLATAVAGANMIYMAASAGFTPVAAPADPLPND